ncbi:MAG: LacI family DNA-binding transcriptional regulator [Candidatus Atribacteria bacterium]|nr:LacI family DNA-binding transcriptional regulator [Candidatus Atribacteria bacterium]MCD6349582.1 LacI family DNA-binding transcriptional regulator [Candidatus Atribacteria bacterium]
MPVTIKDVARLAGVSPATVSLVLSGKGRVSEVTKRKVFEAARKLGYRPNVLARNLVKGKTNTVLLCAFIRGEKLSTFYGNLLNSLLTAVSAQGYYLQMIVKGEFYNGHPLDKRESLLDIARNRLFEGLIVLSHWPVHYSEVSELVKEKFPFVVVNQRVEGDGVSYVDIDHYQGAKEAVAYLIEKGHRRIAHVRGPEGHRHAEERYRAYVDTLLEYGIELRREYIVAGNFRRLSGRQAMEELLETRPLPTAVFCASDKMAIGVLQVAKEKGIKVPDDLAIVGFDGIEAVKYTDPPIPTVEQPLEELGKEAAEILVGKIKGDEAKKIILPCRLKLWN